LVQPCVGRSHELFMESQMLSNSFRQHSPQIEQIQIERLPGCNNFTEWRRGDLSLFQPDEYTELAPLQTSCRRRPHPRGEQTVKDSRRAAALHVAEFRGAQVEAQSFAVFAEVSDQPFGIVLRAFGHDDDRVWLAPLV